MHPTASLTEPPDLRCRPALPGHVSLRTDPLTGDPVLLYPEGILVLNTTAQDILTHCDGNTTIEAMLSILAQEYETDDDEQLRCDVVGCLRGLRQRKLLEFLP